MNTVSIERKKTKKTMQTIETKYSKMWHYFSPGVYAMISLLFLVFSLAILIGKIVLPDIARLCFSLFGILLAICECFESKFEYKARQRGFVDNCKKAADAAIIEEKFNNMLHYDAKHENLWLRINASRFWVAAFCVVGCIAVCVSYQLFDSTIKFPEWFLDCLSILSLLLVFLSYLLKEFYGNKKDKINDVQGEISKMRADARERNE